MNNDIVVVDKILLPEITKQAEQVLDTLTKALKVNREILPSGKQIEYALANLSELLLRIPPELRDEVLAKMCIAVTFGFFDSGINYVWNAAIVELREKVKKFGVHVVPQITDKYFDEEKLFSLQDNELLDLCLKLNLVSEEGKFALDHCRNIRNNFSVAHPTIGKLDEYQFVNFVNEVIKHALNNENNSKGVDIQKLIESIHSGEFSEKQQQAWTNRINATFDAQREAIFGMLHGIYCDASKSEGARINSITLCHRSVDKFTSSVISLIVNRHQDYQDKGKDDQYTASRVFFEKLKLINALSEADQHFIISGACKSLLSVHHNFNNFYNEPPFAQRLASIVDGQDIPDITKPEFVETVLMCSVGNGYGISTAAEPYYRKMIQGFKQREIKIMLDLPEDESALSQRLQNSDCYFNFAKIVGLINPKSVPTQSKTLFDKWMKIRDKNFPEPPPLED